MQATIGQGTEVDHAGQTWRVQRILGVEAVLLRSAAGIEIAADPALLRPTCCAATTEAHARRPDDLRYSENAMCESFFATLECELLERRRFASQAEAKMACFSFIEGWYNPVRLHSA